MMHRVKPLNTNDMRDLSICDLIDNGIDLDIISKRFEVAYSHVKALWRELGRLDN